MEFKVHGEPISEGKDKKKTYDTWEVSQACDTLMRAEEIKKDEELMKLVTVEMGKKKDAINSIDDVIRIRDEKKD
jgi:hypothetical protein